MLNKCNICKCTVKVLCFFVLGFFVCCFVEAGLGEVQFWLVGFGLGQVFVFFFTG